MKQVQDAYIVAATRTPIGRSGRGYFRNTRPDELLVKVLQSALAQVPSLDPQSIEDLICGCAMPEGQQGLNVARVGAVLADLATRSMLRSSLSRSITSTGRSIWCALRVWLSFSK